MQTILGINGCTGKGIANELLHKGYAVRGISRNNTRGPWTHVVADVLNKAQLTKAIAGSEVVYACFGLEYTVDIWKRDWPVAIDNVIDACLATNAKLVFIDNVYMYGLVDDVMTEETPMNPCSKKGDIRKAVAEKLLDAFRNRGLKGSILRCADFYGPDCEKSMITETVFKNMAKGKTAQWLGKTDKVHAFTYIPDLCKAGVTLGLDARADGQIWHAPTDQQVLTGKEWVAQIAKAMNMPPKVTALGSFMVGILGLFIPILKEIKEMMYQYNHDYRFSDAKYQRTFGDIPATPYAKGIKATAQFYQAEAKK
jgi:nucleoside-diphosphate-sugar epimerase